MDFFINRGSTQPNLIMELIKDNHNDYDTFFEDLQGASIIFKMTDVDTNMLKVPYKPAKCVAMDGEEYGIAYEFTENDTDTTGTYQGQFIITFSDGGKLIVPVKDDLKIHIK
jgi:hypothetical protein